MASLKTKEILCYTYAGLLFLSGLALVIVASVLLVKVMYHLTFFPYSALGPLVVVALLGVLHCLLTWLAVHGPRREHNFHIAMFVAFAGALAVGEVACGAWTLVLRDEVGADVSRLVRDSFAAFKPARETDARGWNKAQAGLHCCGVEGPEDYRKAGDDAGGGQVDYPESCYAEGRAGSAAGAAALPDHRQGCQQPLARYARRALLQCAATALVAAAFQLLGVALYCVFFAALRRERQLRIARRTAAATAVAHQEDPPQPQPQPLPRPPPHSPPAPAPTPATTS